MASLAWRHSRVSLSKDESEIAYLLEKLQDADNKVVTEASWRDVSETWQALIALRSHLAVERGHAVIECLITSSAMRPSWTGSALRSSCSILLGARRQT